MNESDGDRRYPHVDTSPTEHEKKVAREGDAERAGDESPTGAADDPGRRPTSGEDLAADRTPGDASTS